MGKSRFTLLAGALSVLVVAVGGCAGRERTTSTTGEARPAQRPAERVSPPPEVDPNAVIWRTPEPPKNPQAGDVWMNPKDGAEMVFVWEGEFTMGPSDAEIAALLKECPNAQAELFADEKPQFRAHLPGYWMDKCEVTVAQYRKFCQETAREMPEAPKWGWQDNHPIVNVTWDDAVAYAKWAGKRLPTEMEWEKAARGTDGREYPWGSQWPPPAGSGNFADEAFTRREPGVARDMTELGFPPLSGYDDGYAYTAPVGEFPGGASPFGALDMAGNVWEWCAGWYDKDAYKRYAKGDLKPPASGTRLVLRGGSWYDVYPWYYRCAFRGSCNPDFRFSDLVGYRCARDAVR
jgi:formylglycine-generating enzyme required for sulfatase activity